MKFQALTSTIALATFFTKTAYADVTPAQIWQNGQNLGTNYGQILTASSINVQGDALVITNLAIGYDQNNIKASPESHRT